jgi:hypothetical protein
MGKLLKVHHDLTEPRDLLLGADDGNTLSVRVSPGKVSLCVGENGAHGYRHPLSVEEASRLAEELVKSGKRALRS